MTRPRSALPTAHRKPALPTHVRDMPGDPACPASMLNMSKHSRDHISNVRQRRCCACRVKHQANEEMTCYVTRIGVCTAPAACGTRARSRSAADKATGAVCHCTAVAHRHCGCERHLPRRCRWVRSSGKVSMRSHCNDGDSSSGTTHQAGRPPRMPCRFSPHPTVCPAAGAAQPIGMKPGTGVQRPPAVDGVNSGDRAAALAAELQCNQDAMAGAAAERRQVLLYSLSTYFAQMFVASQLATRRAGAVSCLPSRSTVMSNRWTRCPVTVNRRC